MRIWVHAELTFDEMVFLLMRCDSFWYLTSLRSTSKDIGYMNRLVKDLDFFFDLGEGEFEVGIPSTIIIKKYH